MEMTMPETRMITLELPANVTIGGPSEVEFSTEHWSADWILENALHGLKQRRSDKYSTATPNKADPVNFTKANAQKRALAELDDKIRLGNPLGGGGGRGPSLSDREKAEREVLALKLESICGLTRTKAQADAKHPDDAWNEITRRIVIQQVGSGKSPDEISSNLENWITTALPAVKSSFEKEILDRMPKETEVKLDLTQILG
jgi:hypothetical protein